MGAVDEEPLRRRLCYRGDRGSPVRGRDRKEGTEKRCGDLLVVGNPGDDELQKAGLIALELKARGISSRRRKK